MHKGEQSMVNYRKPPIEIWGLKIRLERDPRREETYSEKFIPPFEERGFYLTEEGAAFKLVIKNISNSQKDGVLFLTWHLDNDRYITRRLIAFSLEEGEERSYELPTEWLVAPFVGDYRLQIKVDPYELQNRLSRHIIDTDDGYLSVEEGNLKS